jgi:hypothetical protein
VLSSQLVPQQSLGPPLAPRSKHSFFRAVSQFPCFANQRGDSGALKEPIITSTARIICKDKGVRHYFNVGCICSEHPYTVQYAIIPPETRNVSKAAIMMPLNCFGEHSATNTGAVLEIIPTPKPAMARPT